jgi:hypothetical protein
MAQPAILAMSKVQITIETRCNGRWRIGASIEEMRQGDWIFK